MKQTNLLFIVCTIIVTCMIIFGIQFYKTIQVDTTDVDNTINDFIVSADNEIGETQQHIIQTETKVVYIREKTLQKVQALPPDELTSTALDRIERFRTAIRTDHNAFTSRDITDNTRNSN